MCEQFEHWPELLQVERPGRYVGGEVEARPNTAPDQAGRLFKIVLGFPDVYEIAHGHLGHKILYEMINSRAGLTAERVYALWPDWEAVLRRRRSFLGSLESRRPLKDFDLVGFSLQYELGYTTILNMLELGGLPLRAADRPEGSPLVAAGGPGTVNPEPLAPFFDLFFLGDAEASFLEDLEIIKEWRAENAPKSELWDRLAGRPGLYIPSLFQPRYDRSGRFAGLSALKPGYEKINRAVAGSLERAPFPVRQITPLIKPVHDRIVVEIGRGCSRGCRFCQAGYIYRPVRERRRETVLEICRRNLLSSGQDEVSFLSLSAGDHTQITELASDFMDIYAGQTVALSLPSLRVKSLQGRLAAQIRRVRKTGFTLAPEAGSQRLRDVINKDLTEEDLFQAAETAFSLGWKTLKLYFMVGLPTEEDEDLLAMADLARRIKKMGRAQINLGLAHFTPKAQTPFQWHRAGGVQQITERLNKVRAALQTPGLTPKWNHPGASWVEALLARGDRRLAGVLELVQKAGARLEAWGDRFQTRLWEEALEAQNLAAAELLQPFELDGPRPYGHLYADLSQKFFQEELKRAQAGQTSPDCRWADCLGCGACRPGVGIDLARPEPPTGNPAPVPDAAPSKKSEDQSEGFFYLINFKKEGRAAFLGHLEMAEAFKRSFRRAGIGLLQSQGFHPQPKLSFLSALPLGIISEDEYLRVGLIEPLNAEALAGRLSPQLPEGLTLVSAAALSSKALKPRARAATWRAVLEQPSLRPGPPLHPEAHLSYTDKKGRLKSHSLPDLVIEARALDPYTAVLTIKIGSAGTPKPLAAVAALWNLGPDLGTASLKKLKTILDYQRCPQS